MFYFESPRRVVHLKSGGVWCIWFLTSISFTSCYISNIRRSPMILWHFFPEMLHQLTHCSEREKRRRMTGEITSCLAGRGGAGGGNRVMSMSDKLWPGIKRTTRTSRYCTIRKSHPSPSCVCQSVRIASLLTSIFKFKYNKMSWKYGKLF